MDFVVVAFTGSCQHKIICVCGANVRWRMFSSGTFQHTKQTRKNNNIWLDWVFWIGAYGLPDTLLFSIAYYYTNWNKEEKKRINPNKRLMHMILFYIYSHIYSANCVIWWVWAPIIIKTVACTLVDIWICTHNINMDMRTQHTSRLALDVRKFDVVCDRWLLTVRFVEQFFSSLLLLLLHYVMNYRQRNAVVQK